MNIYIYLSFRLCRINKNKFAIKEDFTIDNFTTMPSPPPQGAE